MYYSKIHGIKHSNLLFIKMSKNTKRIRSVGTNTNGFGSDLDWKKTATVRVPSRLKERCVNHVRLSDSTDLKDIYSFGKQIGQGGFGTVVSVYDKQTDKNWALKIVSKAAVGDKIESIYREIQILKMVVHPHIIYLEKVFESQKKIYLLLELCFGTLSTIYDKKRPFSEVDTRKIIGELASAVSYLHKNDIVHRDLKLENILIAKNPDDENDKLYIKITDFGLSIVKKGNDYESMLHDCCGTLVYMAPEIITSHSYSQQCDVWAIGVIMYMLLSGKLPFYSDHESNLAAMICNNEPIYDFPSTREAVDLMIKMLNKNPALRATAIEVLQHAWIIGQQIDDSKATENVLDMMRLWRSEMMLPVGDECDWVSKAKAINSTCNTTTAKATPEVRERTVNVVATNVARKQSMHLPIKNIRFEKSGKKTDQQENNEGRRGSTNTQQQPSSFRRKSDTKGFKK